MIAERVSKKLASEGKEKTGQHKPQHQKLSLFKKIFVGFLLAIGFVLYVLCITQPFSLEEQVIFPLYAADADRDFGHRVVPLRLVALFGNTESQQLHLCDLYMAADHR